MSDRALRYFLAVVRTGSIRAAAETLNVAASAISRQIAEMEAANGIILLERLPRGVIPTEAGRVMAEHAQRSADDTVLLNDRLLRLRGVQTGTVRICCGHGFLPDLMEHGLTSFSAKYSEISFIVSTGTTSEIQAAVAVGDADIGISINPIEHPEVRTAVMSRQPLSAIVLPCHPLAEVDHPVALRMFAAEPVVLPPPDYSLRQLLGRVEAEGNFRLMSRLQTGSFELHRQFVMLGMGTAFMPPSIAAIELRDKNVRAIPLSDPLLSQIAVHLIVRDGRRLPEAVRGVVAWLAKNLISLQPVA